MLNKSQALKGKLSDEFSLVFMRLHLGLLEQDLAQRFCVSVSTVSVIATNIPDCFKKFPTQGK